MRDLIFIRKNNTINKRLCRIIETLLHMIGDGGGCLIPYCYVNFDFECNAFLCFFPINKIRNIVIMIIDIVPP